MAEGFSRYSYADKTRFYYMSRGSISEVQNQLIIAKDLKYIEKEDFDELFVQTIVVNKLVNGLIRSCKNNL
ncbi:MAG: four helix bundle protein [Candidatus Paceibacterota bacterium]